MLARVSSIEAFRRWRLREDATPDELVQWITHDDPSPAMLAGTAFHRCLEESQPGLFDVLSANGHTFHMPDVEMSLPDVREVRASKRYGELVVTGKFDALIGNRIIDHKTTARFDADGYMEGCQWRFYLDIFGADVFQWNVFELRPRDELMVFDVAPPQILTQYRYPGLHEDCERLASDYYDFAVQFMPDYSPELEKAA